MDAFSAILSAVRGDEDGDAFASISSAAHNGQQQQWRNNQSVTTAARPLQ